MRDNQEMEMTEEDNIDFESAVFCCICKKTLLKIARESEIMIIELENIVGVLMTDVI
jgi:hypothetical protein